MNIKILSEYHLLSDTSNKYYESQLKVIFKNVAALFVLKSSYKYIEQHQEYSAIKGLMMIYSENKFKANKYNESRYYAKLIAHTFRDTTNLYKYFESENILPPTELVKEDTKEKILISKVKESLGSKYKWAGQSPLDGGFDCSGFQVYLFSFVGVTLYHNANQIALRGRKIDMKQVKTGDLVVFGSPKSGRHVAMIIRTGDVLKIAHCTYRGVVVDSYSEGSYWRKSYVFRIVRYF